MNRLEKLKQQIRTFVNDHKSENRSLFEDNNEVILNKAIFDVESFIIDLRNEYNLNQRIDTTIVSDNILQHFNSTSHEAAFRPVDYQFNFLHYLATHFTEQIDLYKLVNGFIDAYKHEFTLADIIITQTGVTRCKTNIRFAINGLRQLGLVLNHNEQNRRSWSPSILGLVALLNIRFINDIEKKKTHKTVSSLKTLDTPNYRLSKYQDYDPTLLQSLSQFKKDPDRLYMYLSAQRDNALERKEIILLDSIMNDFINFTGEGLKITKDGVKKTRDFDEKSKEFQRNLFATTEKNRVFANKLFNHFKQAQIDKT